MGCGRAGRAGEGWAAPLDQVMVGEGQESEWKAGGEESCSPRGRESLGSGKPAGLGEEQLSTAEPSGQVKSKIDFRLGEKGRCW